MLRRKSSSLTNAERTEYLTENVVGCRFAGYLSQKSERVVKANQNYLLTGSVLK
jgi:hypothetical protein